MKFKKTKGNKVLVILSGGVDSTTLCYYLKSKGHKVSALTFDYGQKHKREIESARNVSKRLNIPHSVLDISSLQKPLKSSLTTLERPIPKGSYTSKTMKSTVVPNRNMIFLSIAAGIASSQGIRYLGFAAHGGDHFIYADCRPLFINSMNGTLMASFFDDKVRPSILAPFVDIDKADIVAIGTALKVPFELTWSCYVGGEKHCGKCGTCQERREAFEKVGIKDPTEYEH